MERTEQVLDHAESRPPARREWQTPELVRLRADATANGLGTGSDGSSLSS